MPFERANIIQIRPNVCLIDDAGESTCYLITGREKALLVDTVNGYEDLHAIVRTITDLPVVVVNTHGHGDHVFGNVYFDEAWMHPADFWLYEACAERTQDMLEEQGLRFCPVKPLQIGQIFDLGGVQLEVVDLKGRTLMPGLNDTHYHPILNGMIDQDLDSGIVDTGLGMCKTIPELLDLFPDRGVKQNV